MTTKALQEFFNRIADDATVDNSAMAGRSSAKGDIGFSIDCVRCIRKTGRWLASRA